MDMADEYQPLGLTMANLTIGYGAMLIIWGIAVSLLAESDSFTSYIPSIFGVGILIPGIMTNARPEQKIVDAHSCCCRTCLCLGGTRVFMVIGDGLDYASASMLMLFVTGSIYTYLCVQSFRHARKSGAK